MNIIILMVLCYILENGQKLYVRLFQRKLMWHRRNKIVYPKIAPDLQPFLNELVSAKLLLNGGYSKHSIAVYTWEKH